MPGGGDEAAEPEFNPNLTMPIDPTDDPQQRRRDLAAIHASATALGMDTADKNPASEYRAMLLQHGGSASAASLDAAGRRRVLAHLRRAAPKPKDGWQAELIRRLWAQLGQLGALNDPSDRGLNAFVLSQTRIASPRFLTAAQRNQVIEALKGWLKRAQAKPTTTP